MAEKLPKIILPKDPVRIGTTPDGQPVHLDMKEMIATPDENLERWDNTLALRRHKVILDIAQKILDNAGRFVEETFFNTASKSGQELFKRGDRRVGEYALKNGYEAVQDGLTTVIKIHGKIVRTMNANVPMGFGPAVANQVNKMVKKLPKYG